MNKPLFSQIFFTLFSTALALVPFASYARAPQDSGAILGSVCITDSDCRYLDDYVCEGLGTGYRLNQIATNELTKIPASGTREYNYQKVCKLKNNVDGCTNGKSNMNGKVNIMKNGIVVSTNDLQESLFCSGSLKCNTSSTAVATNGICTQTFGKDDAKNLELGEETSDIRGKVLRFVTLALSFLAILGVVIIIYAGASWASSFGNEEKVTKARKMLIAAAIGLLIITIAWTITSYVINFGGQLS
jgi:hypothetical protein